MLYFLFDFGFRFEVEKYINQVHKHVACNLSQTASCFQALKVPFWLHMTVCVPTPMLCYGSCCKHCMLGAIEIPFWFSKKKPFKIHLLFSQELSSAKLCMNLVPGDSECWPHLKICFLI